jgi:tetratricopeptide (TPR) repeat protein
MTIPQPIRSSAVVKATCAPSVISLLLLLGLVFPMGCKPDPSARAEEAFARAQDLLKQNKPDAAIIELSRAIQAKPDMAKAHHDLAKLYFERGDTNSGFREYSLAVRYNPQDREAYQSIGEVLLTAREFAKAKDTASQILTQWPDDRHARYLSAESMMGLGDWDNARKLVEQDAAEEPDGAHAQFDLAALLIHDKKWPAAEQQLRLTWRLDPKILLTPLVLAQLLEFQGNGKGAEEALKRASEEHGNRTEPLFALAGFYLRARRFADAEETFKKIQIVDPKNPASRVALGEFYAATGRPDAAEKEFQRMVAENPGDTLSLHHLTEVEIMLNRRDEARRIANDLMKRDAKDWQALTLLGRLDLEEGKATQAERELNQAKAVNPDSPMITFQLARVYLVQGRPDSAKSALCQSLNRAPNYVAARILLAGLELRAGQTDVAVQDLNKALKQAPSAMEPNLMLSQAYTMRGEFNLAEDTLNRLLNQSTAPASQVMILETLAEVKFRQGRYAEAVLLATKILDTGMLSREGLRVLGMSYLAQKRPELGLKTVEEFVDKADRWAAGQDVLGEIALIANNLDAAEQAYQKELEITPSSSSALFGLGNVYDQRQQYDKAADFFRRFAAAEPTNASVHVRLGIIAERSQDFQKAISEYQSAINIDSADAIAKNNLAWVYAEHIHNLDVALPLAQEARRLQPSNPNIADTLGWILVKMNLGENALPYLKECVAKNKWNPVYHYHLGIAYLKAGRKSDAKSELRTALQSRAPFAGSVDAKEALESISSSQ